MPRERGEDGQYQPTVDVEDVLGVFDAVRGPVVTSADVAEKLGVSSEAARQKLNRAVDRGDLEKRKTAGRVVYWRETARDRAVERDPEHRAPAQSHTQDSGSETGLDDLTFERDLTRARRRHLEEWLAFVREGGEGVQKSDFVAWYTDDRADETGYNAGAFWEAFAKAAMKQLQSFVKPNARTYKWVGDR